MGPRGLVDWRVVPLGQVAGVKGVADRLSGGGDRAGSRLARGAHSLGNFKNDIGIGGRRAPALDLDPLAGPCRADQHPAGLDPHGVSGADGEAGPENRPARRSGDGPRWLGRGYQAGERLAGCAQLGQDERVFEGAFGVICGLGAFQPVEPGSGRGRVVTAWLGEAAVGEVGAEPGEGVPVGGPAAGRPGGLRERAQQRDRVPGRVPRGFQLAAERAGDLSGGAVGAGLAAGLRRPVVVTEQRFQDRLVEPRVSSGPGGRARGASLRWPARPAARSCRAAGRSRRAAPRGWHPPAGFARWPSARPASW